MFLYENYAYLYLSLKPLNIKNFIIKIPKSKLRTSKLVTLNLFMPYKVKAKIRGFE